jgi:glycosyltransferase involved in cell wall biosynthesis
MTQTQSAATATTTLAVPPRTTFVLPGRNRSGGVRVTVEMANRLEAAGYKTRIAVLRDRAPLLKRLLARVDDAVGALRGLTPDDWLDQYTGRTVEFDSLAEVPTEDDEVVIAVGSHAVPWVDALPRPRRRVRFCHGFHHFRTGQRAAAWGTAVPTLTVSRTLIPGLRQYGGEFPVWHVPNGIDPAEYHPVDTPRTRIGTIWSSNLAKSPDDIREAVRRLKAALPDVEVVAFGAERRPKGLDVDRYWRLPPLDEVRRIYSSSKVWLLMSQSEGLPGPVLEAMACGCVVVSSDNEGSREIIRDGDNGLLFPTGNVPACVDAVRALWSDGPRLTRLAASGAGTASEFTWEAAVEKMRRALDDLARDERRWIAQ